MKQFECIEDKRIYTESQLQQLFQFKVVHWYDKKFEDWIKEEIQNGYLRVLTDVEIANNHIKKYNSSKRRWNLSFRKGWYYGICKVL